MKKKILFLLVLICSIFTLVFISNSPSVNAATSYYSSISDTATGTALQLSLRTLITNTHTTITSYDDCKNPDIVKKTDGNASGSKIVLFWSGIEVSTTWDSGKTWNREHVWPQSKGWFEESGAGSDLHHIRPTDPSVNSSHNNNPYGIVSSSDYCTTSSTNGKQKIDAKCKNGYFEPGDDKKGDTARIIFYLLVRYSQSDSYPITNVAKSMDMLLEWNELDPVDASERRRNEAVAAIQGNRNPFIDNSYYADLIWGGASPEDNPGSGSGSGSSGSSTVNPNIPSDGKVATFELGENGTYGNDSDSSSALTTYTETNSGYTLSLNNLSRVYEGCDAVGNSCLKLGTASVVGSFSFDVPSEIDKVLVLATAYKAYTSIVNINGTTKTLSTSSTNGEYTNISVDTTSTKTVSISTTTSGYRCKINTIVFYDLDGDGSQSGGNSGTDNPISNVESALSTLESFNTKASLILDYNYDTYSYTTSGSYSYTFTSKVYSSATATTLNGVKWDPETTLLNSSGTKYYGYDRTKGQQFGSAKNPFKEVILKTVDNILDGVTKVTIQASGASDTNATISAYVGTSKIGETKKLTSTNKTYTFTSSTGMRGNVKFVIKQSSSTAIYVKGMSIKYDGETNYSNIYSLNTAGIRFGGYITKDIYNLLNQTDTKWGVEYVAGNASNLTTSSVKTVYCTPAQVSQFNSTETSSSGNYYQWSLLVSNLNNTHLDKTISARLFVEYDGVRYYMGTSTHSIKTLATSYLSSLPSEYTNHTGILEHLKNS